MAASRPFCGSTSISCIARSVAAMKARSCVALLLIALVPAIRPLPGSGTAWSTRRTVLRVPDSSSCTGSLLMKPVAASTAPWASAAP